MNFRASLQVMPFTHSPTLCLSSTSEASLLLNTLCTFSPPSCLINSYYATDWEGLHPLFSPPIVIFILKTWLIFCLVHKYFAASPGWPFLPFSELLCRLTSQSWQLKMYCQRGSSAIAETFLSLLFNFKIICLLPKWTVSCLSTGSTPYLMVFQTLTIVSSQKILLIELDFWDHGFWTICILTKIFLVFNIFSPESTPSYI